MTTIRITPGATGQSVKVRVYTDAGYANVSPLAYNATGLSVSYARDNGAPVAIALVALSSATAAYSSGGWIHVGAGVYRLDLPDAAVAAGASMVAILVADAADIRADAPLIVLDVATSTRSAFDPATQTVRADVRQIKGDGDEDVLDGLRAIGTGYTSDGTLNASVSTFDAFAVGQIGAAKPGDAMTLTAGERTSVGVAVWSATTRGLTTFGTLVADVWGYAVGAGRTLAAAYDRAKTAATPAEVSPTINPTPVTVTPTLTTQQATQLAAAATSAADAVSATDANTLAITQLTTAVGGIGGGGGGGSDAARLDQIIAMLQTDPPTAGGLQQFNARKIVRGDTYGPTSRPLIVTRHRSASWPTDLSTWAWVLVSNKQAGNVEDGTSIIGTVAVTVATGESQAFAITLPATAGVALGRHVYAIRGTQTGSKRWSAEIGTIDVLDGLS